MNPIFGRRGAVVALHSLVAQASLDILRGGDNAIEASIAVAATLPVVYPHMSGIGVVNCNFLAYCKALFFTPLRDCR
jgi:gamma-glutamyltranspeptidase/glutathione hydrolase